MSYLKIIFLRRNGKKMEQGNNSEANGWEDLQVVVGLMAQNKTVNIDFFTVLLITQFNCDD